MLGEKTMRTVPVGELRPTKGRGPIFADKQFQVAVWRGEKNNVNFIILITTLYLWTEMNV